MMHENSKHKHNYKEWKKKIEKKGTKLDKQELCPAISTHACIGTLLTRKPKVTLESNETPYVVELTSCTTLRLYVRHCSTRSMITSCLRPWKIALKYSIQHLQSLSISYKLKWMTMHTQMSKTHKTQLKLDSVWSPEVSKWKLNLLRKRVFLF